MFHQVVWTRLSLLLCSIKGRNLFVTSTLQHSHQSSIRVFTLGSWQESWRTVRTNLKHRCHDYACGQCIKGETYYLAYSKPGYDMVVMSFDVRSEIFYMIELPLGIDYIDYAVLISYDGSLACIDGDNDTRLWILEDASKHKWLFQDFQKITGIWLYLMNMSATISN